ncbi:MAG: RluA family pseudouridine synthase [Chloroflexota bacterium]
MGERIVKFQVIPKEKIRLDKVLVANLPELSRVRLQGLIKNDCVRIDGVVETKSSRIIERQVEIEVIIPASVATSLIAENIPLDILFENGDLIAINKPAGMVVHPAVGHGVGTLVNAVLGYAPDIEGIGGEERPGIVHRLDKDTSGIILVAKNERAHRWLQDQFRLRLVEKSYLALVDGAPPTPSGRVEASIGRDPAHRKKMSVTSPGRGREAISEYRLVEKFKEHALLEFHPLTGRTHQIRLHCTLLGCPIVGDRVYGRKKPSIDIERHFLHAYRLKIMLPGEGEAHIFEAQLPQDLQQVLDDLKSIQLIDQDQE